MKERAPFGSWPSPIGIDVVTSGRVRTFGGVWLVGERVAWLETRPDEGGRMALVAAGPDGRPADLVPAGFNVRTRVHEYGGGACWFHDETAFCSSFDDSRLYRLDPGEEPRAITPEPPAEHSRRYADGVVTPDGAKIVCVRERHESDEIVNELVALPADGSGDARVLVSGCDFYSTPRLAPDGRTLAWLQWNHPNMPWDGTELWTGELGEDVVTGARLAAGGAEESIFQPEWSPAGVLHFCSDRTGWWNLYALADGEARQIAPVVAEVGLPQWLFGSLAYAFLDDGRIARKVCDRAVDRLELVDPASGEVEPSTGRGPSSARARWTRAATSSRSRPPGRASPYAVVVFDTQSGERRVVRRSFEVDFDVDAISEPRAIEFPTRDGATAHAFYYPPLSATHEAPAGELPPLRVICHGGPTSNTGSALSVSYQFWTSRGVGVVDVNYRGSTGFGRPYRDALRGRWGEIDVTDCIDAAAYLAEQGEVDPERICDRGRQRRRVRRRSARSRCIRASIGAGDQPLRRRRPGGLRRDDPQVRVALPRLARRPVSGGGGAVPGAVAAVPRGRHRQAAARPPGARRQGRAAEPGGADGRGARAAGKCRTRTSRSRARATASGAATACAARSRRSCRSSAPVFGFEPADEIEPLEIANL